jgi:hypothetical protein
MALAASKFSHPAVGGDWPLAPAALALPAGRAANCARTQSASWPKAPAWQWQWHGCDALAFISIWGKRKGKKKGYPEEKGYPKKKVEEWCEWEVEAPKGCRRMNGKKPNERVWLAGMNGVVNGDIVGRKEAPLKIKEMWDWDDGLIVRKWTMMAHSIAGPGNDGTWAWAPRKEESLAKSYQWCLACRNYFLKKLKLINFLVNLSTRKFYIIIEIFVEKLKQIETMIKDIKVTRRKTNLKNLKIELSLVFVPIRNFFTSFVTIFGNVKWTGIVMYGSRIEKKFKCCHYKPIQ